MKPALVLASTSPRRRALLSAAGIVFVLGEPGPEPLGSGAPRDLALQRARSKGDGGRRPVGVIAPILAVDTVVDVDDEELGKPADATAAMAMLRRLRGRMHRVHTAHCLIDPDSGRRFEELATSTVRCRAADDAELQAYVDGGEWRGKAGGYGIQDRSQDFFDLVDGALDTVIGLHVEAVHRLLLESAR